MAIEEMDGKKKPFMTNSTQGIRYQITFIGPVKRQKAS